MYILIPCQFILFNTQWCTEILVQFPIKDTLDSAGPVPEHIMLTIYDASLLRQQLHTAS